MKIVQKFLLALVLFGGIHVAVSAQEATWSENTQNRGEIVTDKAVARASFPTEFKLFNLNIDPVRDQLLSIVDGRAGSTFIFLPNADGNMEQFEVFEASNFDAELQARFPDIRAFSGRSLTDPHAILKLSISPRGLQTMVFRTETANEYIEPYSQDRTVYAVFRANREKGGSPWSCSTEEKKMFKAIDEQVWRADVPQSSSGELRTLRLAQSCNGEYANFFGASTAGTPADTALVLAAFNATLTRSNGVYEKDLGIHLNLIANTTAVIYYNPATDPYTTLSNWNNQLQGALAANIGAANYDIGHMFGASGGGGNAGCIGCVCSADDTKGRGITSPADGIPQGDNFDIDYVVHEVGHQLGGNHTFSFSLEAGGANNVEVGSGITIMGYAGITGFDVAPHSIDIFHQRSIQQIQNNIATRPCPAGQIIPMTLNSPPVVAALTNYTIPITTPFALTGSATDPQNDPLTYNWEQNDNATTSGASSVASPTKLTGPNWLSFGSSTSPTRTFPRLSTILAGLNVTPPLAGGDAGANIEALSSVSRTLNFRLTARDNRPYVPGATIGQTQFADMTVTVTSAAGPFQVTFPNANEVFLQGSTQTVTWSVNNTTAAPVSVANVRILMSTDGGNTFPTVLAANTPNDGSQAVTLPMGLTTTARIKVEAIGNIFFDISNTNFTINDGTGTPTPTATPTSTPTATPTPSAGGVFSYTGPAVAIPDADPNGVSVTVPVTCTGNITDVDFRFDGVQSPVLGNPGVGVTHSWVGDLAFRLTSPGGTSVTFFDRPGYTGTGFGCTNNNISQLLLNDQGGFPSVEDNCDAAGANAAFPTGTFSPNNPFAPMNGGTASGTWTLTASDGAGGDTGEVRAFSIILNNGNCGGVTPSPTPTPSATATPTATPTPGGASNIFAVDLRNLDFDRLATNNPVATRIVNNLTTGQSAFYGGDFANNDFSSLIVVNDFNDTLGRFNTTTGAITAIGSTGAPAGAGTWVDLTFDRTTSTMYALSNSATTGTSVYTVNLTTGLATLVASNNVTTSLVIDGAIHPTTGVFYGVDITGDNLVTINKTTAAVTVVGPLGFNAAFAQGMDFDDSTGILYWGAYQGAAAGPGQLRTINTATGASTLIGDLSNGVAGETVELDAFAVAASGGGPTPTPTSTPLTTPTPTATPTPAGGVCTTSYTGPAVVVPDNIPAGVNIPVTVSGVGTLTDLNFRFDTGAAGACDATVGNTNAAVDHTFIGDLTFRLTPPSGSPTVAFQARRGGTRENICLSTLDDEGGFPNISTLTSATGQFQSGNFSPETTGQFSGLDGTNANGVWTLNVSDNAGLDTGSMRRFSLVMTGTGCAGGTTPTPTATPTATPTNTPTATPTPTPTNLVQFSAASYINDESQVGDVPQQTVVTVTRTGVTTGVTTVTAGPGGTGTANVAATCAGNADIAAAPVVLTFAAGETSKTFNVTNCPDTLYEIDETRQFTLTAVTGGGVGAQGTTNVIVNDTANQFRNTTPIDLFQGTTSAPYPSNITVAGPPLNVHRVRVTLYDFYHSTPDNLKVLLVNPQGRKYILMGDAGGPVAITQNGHVTLTFTDLAGQVLPDSTALTRGKFEPTNWQTTINDFPAPAPAGPYAQPGSTVGGTVAQTLFGNFGQLDANGVWSLYIRDDNGGNAPEVLLGGVQGGWGLELLPATAAGVEISGRVLTPDGRGLRNATVQMVDSQGVVRTATTSSFGYYSFDGIEAGSSIVMSVESRRYRFAPRIIQVIDTLTDVDFQGQE